MSDLVLFQMPSYNRSQLIEKHEFYVRQAKARLLDQFTDDVIKAEADETTDASWQARGQHFNPERDDPSDCAEAALKDGAWRYELLNDLRDSVRMNIISGFFHEWEKALGQWLADEVNHWHSGDELTKQIWRVNFDRRIELLESFGWPLKSEPWFAALDACRLVVNVHKHGDGGALKSLVQSYPKFLVHPLESFGYEVDDLWNTPQHEHLKVTDTDLVSFAEAITEFWKAVPDDVADSQLINPPTWVVNAIDKDLQQAAHPK